MAVSLEHWRQQRASVQQLLQQALTGSLCGLRKSELSWQLERLCLQLIDYVSIGHLTIYSPIRNARNACLLERQLQRLQEQIGRITDRVLSFNRRYETGSLCASPGRLHEDLLKLYRCMSMRFALEEQWIELRLVQQEGGSGSGIGHAEPDPGEQFRDSARRRECWQQSSLPHQSVQEPR